MSVIKLLRRDAVDKPSAPSIPPREAIAFQSDVSAIELRPAPLWARGTIVLTVLAMLIALAWAAFAHFDKIVTAQGRLVAASPKLVVGPLEVSTVRAIRVQPGDVVRQDQILAELDPTFAAADMAMSEKRLKSLESRLARLRAEIGEAAFAPGPFGEDGLTQAALLDGRLRERAARRVSFEREAAELKAAIATREEESRRLAELLVIAQEIETMRAELVEKRAAPRLQLMEAQERRIDLEKALAANDNERRELDERLVSVGARRETFEREWRREVAEDLERAQNERAAMVEEVAKARRRNSLVELRAPVDAVVLEVADRAVGSILQEAQPIITLVPLNTPIEVEAQIAAGEVGGVRIGDTVRVKLDSFPFQKHGLLEGRVRTISEDAFVNEGEGGTGGMFYRVRIELVRTELKDVRPNLRLLPGMTLQAEIRVGERTVLSYFLYPIIRTLDESLEEA